MRLRLRVRPSSCMTRTVSSSTLVARGGGGGGGASREWKKASWLCWSFYSGVLVL